MERPNICNGHWPYLGGRLNQLCGMAVDLWVSRHLVKHLPVSHGLVTPGNSSIGRWQRVQAGFWSSATNTNIVWEP